MTTRPSRRNLVLATSLMLLLGACSGGSTSATPPASVNTVTAATSVPVSADTAPPASTDGSGAACTIVTHDAVSLATGFQVEKTSGTDSICYYQNADLSKYLVVQLYESQADMTLMLQIEPGSEHVASLGDDAFWTGTGLLFVRQGNHGIELLDPDLAGGPADTASRDALVRLARTALPSL